MDIELTEAKQTSVNVPYPDAPTVDHEALDLVFYIIGDKFQRFSDNNTVLTLSEAIEHIAIIVRIAQFIILGQGLNKDEVLLLKQKVHQQRSLRKIIIIDKVSQKIDKHLVQKLDDKNVLISCPQRVDTSNYISELIIDDDCAEMSDDYVGQYINGVLLVEAARQMFVGCVLTSDLSPEFRARAGNMQFTLSKIDIRFDNFVFPLTTKLHLRFSDIHIHGESAKGAANVRFYQFDRECCEITFQATAYTEKLFSCIEKRNAAKVRKRIGELAYNVEN